MEGQRPSPRPGYGRATYRPSDPEFHDVVVHYLNTRPNDVFKPPRALLIEAIEEAAKLLPSLEPDPDVPGPLDSMSGPVPQVPENSPLFGLVDKAREGTYVFTLTDALERGGCDPRIARWAVFRLIELELVWAELHTVYSPEGYELVRSQPEWFGYDHDGSVSEFLFGIYLSDDEIDDGSPNHVLLLWPTPNLVQVVRIPEEKLLGRTEAAVSSLKGGGTGAVEKASKSPITASELHKKPKRQKRSTAKGYADNLILAMLLEHHHYETPGKAANKTPVGVRELVEMSGKGSDGSSKISVGAVSNFFKKHFGSHQSYKALCRRPLGDILGKLKKLGADFADPRTRGDVSLIEDKDSFLDQQHPDDD